MTQHGHDHDKVYRDPCPAMLCSAAVANFKLLSGRRLPPLQEITFTTLMMSKLLVVPRRPPGWIRGGGGPEV